MLESYGRLRTPYAFDHFDKSDAKGKSVKGTRVTGKSSPGGNR